MSNPLGGRCQDKLMAICSFPSINLTPCKHGIPIPYPVWKMMGNSESTTPTVKFNGEECYALDKTLQPTCKGDFIGAGGGIKSGTVGDEVKPTEGSVSIKVEGCRLIRKGDPCTLNHANTFGKYTALGDFLSGFAHFALGALSILPPPVGTIASIADSALYAVEGDMVNAGMSLVGAIPGAKVAMIASKAGKAVSVASKGAGTLAKGAGALTKLAKAIKHAGGTLIKGASKRLKCSKCMLAKAFTIGSNLLSARDTIQTFMGAANYFRQVSNFFGAPVHALYGSKVLADDDDLDYSGVGYLPFYLQRIYNSQNPNIGWFGQGWTAQGYEQRLEIDPQHDLINLIDNSGRKVPFTYLKPGQRCYQPYEDITLYRLPLDEAHKHTTLDGQMILADAESGARLGIDEPLTYILYDGNHDPNKHSHYQGIAQHFSHLSQRQIKAGSVIKATLLASKQTDQYGHELQLHYTHSPNSELAHLPSHITDDANDCYQLEFIILENETGKHPRLHKLWQLTQANQYTLLNQYHYNQSADLVRVTCQTYDTREFCYTDHLITEQTLSNGTKAYYRYNQTQDIKTAKVIEHWLDNGEHYQFDYHTDAKGHHHTTVTEQRGTELERQHHYQYDDWYNLTQYTDPMGNRTRIYYDDLNRITDIYSPQGGHSKFQYHGKQLGTLAIKVGIHPKTGRPEYRRVLHQYDLEDRLIAIIDPLGNTSGISYNEQGEVAGHADSLGNQTHYTYDEQGNLTKQTLANGSTYHFIYDQYGNLSQQTDCSGHSTYYQYDDKQRLIAIKDAEGNQSEYHYDQSKPWLDLIKHIHYPDQTSVHLEHDDTGRLLKHTDAKGNQSQYEYSIDDLPTKRIDALGHTLSYEYDNLRRLSKLTNENGEHWTFQYDKTDNLIAETRFDGYSSHYRYNKAGQLIQQTDNPNNNREQQKHTYLQRNLLGQLTHKHILDIKDGKQRHYKSKYHYDLVGQLIQANSPDASTHLEYNRIGQIISESLIRHHKHKSNHIKQTLTHEYDELGNRVKTTLPDGKTLNQLYYGSGHLYNQSLTDNNGETTEIRHSETNALHQEISRQQGQLISAFGYDSMGRLSKQYSTNQDKNHISIERHYTYDVLGQLTNITGRTRLDKQQHYQRGHQYNYDPIGRLTQHKLSDFAKYSGTTETFAFDPASNRVPVSTEQVEDNKSKQWKRTNSLKTHNKHIEYRYDAHGRIEYKTQTPLGTDGEALKQSGKGVMGYMDTLKLSYNANNELEQSVRIHQQGFEVVTTTTYYSYDAFGRRIAKHSEIQKKSRLTIKEKLLPFERAYQSNKTNKSTTLMLWDGNRQAQEYTDTHVFTTVYEQGSFEPVARLVWLKPNLLDASNDEVYTTKIDTNKPNNPIQVYHYHNDHLGTPNELTNYDGEVVWLADYEAWGNTAKVVWHEQKIEQIPIAKEELQPLRFQGQMIDSETGLHYNRFRYYDPDLGMFISRDPIGLLGGNNVFAYAPNPTGWVDPWGLAKKSSSRKPKHVNTKSTARTKPRNKNEKFAMDFVKKHSEKGNEVIKPSKIGDPCFKDKGWSKMSMTINGVEIHYMAQIDKKGNVKTVTDFKFKDPDSPEKIAKRKARNQKCTKL